MSRGGGKEGKEGRKPSTSDIHSFHIPFLSALSSNRAAVQEKEEGEKNVLGEKKKEKKETNHTAVHFHSHTFSYYALTRT